LEVALGVTGVFTTQSFPVSVTRSSNRLPRVRKEVPHLRRGVMDCLLQGSIAPTSLFQTMEAGEVCLGGTWSFELQLKAEKEITLQALKAVADETQSTSRSSVESAMKGFTLRKRHRFGGQNVAADECHLRHRLAWGTPVSGPGKGVSAVRVRTVSLGCEGKRLFAVAFETVALAGLCRCASPLRVARIHIGIPVHPQLMRVASVCAYPALFSCLPQPELAHWARAQSKVRWTTRANRSPNSRSS
jgi:hypothetical protein